MKNLILTLILIAGVSGLQAQKIWYEPEGALMDEEITIYIDIAKCDNQSIVTEGKLGEDMYIWTWKPVEHPEGHPYVNGLGSQAWKNSNPALKMERVDPSDLTSTVFSFTMIPTEFYEVDAKTVYDEDIWLLAKPLDGGGYGDPDYKTEDLNLGLEPPKSEAALVKGFPSVPFVDDVFSVIYDNTLETAAELIGLGEDEAYVYAAAWDSTNTTNKADYEISNFFLASRQENLKMTYVGDGKFQFTMIPQEFFGFQPNHVINKMKFIVMKKNTTHRTDKDLEIEINCWK